MYRAPYKPRVDVWVVSIPSLGYKEHQIFNMTQFCKALNFTYSNLMGFIHQAKVQGKATVSLKCKEYGDVKVGWHYLMEALLKDLDDRKHRLSTSLILAKAEAKKREIKAATALTPAKRKRHIVVPVLSKRKTLFQIA